MWMWVCFKKSAWVGLNKIKKKKLSLYEKFNNTLSQICIDRGVKFRLSLSHFNETWILSKDFRKNPKISHLKKIRPVGGSIVPCGRTDITKLTVAFRSFRNAPKNLLSMAYCKEISWFRLVDVSKITTQSA